ncbi:MAG: glycosyltransferase family 2 protein [Parcubacteria group bacterium]|nr:glycosyltransferase family 2 protein [Parcubacteria group bacterium]
MKTLIIIPAYHESKKIFDVVAGVRERGYDAVVVDDASSDATSGEARRAGARVLRHFVNRGYGAALSTGNAYALRHGYDIAVHFDGDGQHDAREIARVIGPIQKGEADVVVGSRFLQAGASIPLLRKFLIKLAIIFTWAFSGVKLTDAHNGFRAFSRRALEVIDCRQDGMSYASEVIDQIAEHVLAVKEVPVTITYTGYSKAKGESNIKKVMLGVRFLWGKVIK